MLVTPVSRMRNEVCSHQSVHSVFFVVILPSQVQCGRVTFPNWEHRGIKMNLAKKTKQKKRDTLTGCIQAKCFQINKAQIICRHRAFKGNPAYGTNFDGLSVKSLLCSCRAGGWRVKALHLCCYPFLDNCVGGGGRLKAYIYPLWCNCSVYSLIA